MKVTTNYGPLLAHGEKAFALASGDTLKDVRAEAGRHSRTGQHAASLRMTARSGQRGGKMTVSIGSPLAQARAVERGADVGPRRGPHMTGIHAIQIAASKYPDNMTRRLRETAI